MDRIIRYALFVIAILIVVVTASIAVPYFKISKYIDQELARGPFSSTYSFYAAPEIIAAGDAMTPEQLVAGLKRSGYKESQTPNVPGSYRMEGPALTIYPAAQASYSAPVRIEFGKGVIGRISDASGKTRLDQYELGPQLITNISDEGREKRILVKFSDLPTVLVQAIVSAEDKRFFQHAG